LTHKEVSSGVVTLLDDVLEFDGEVSATTSKKDFIWISESRLTEPPRRVLYKINKEKWVRDLSIPFYKISHSSLVHSTYEFTKYQSFDGLEIPSYLIVPKGKIKGAIITAFYGGRNYYNYHYQILAELGFICLSPAVRGSWGHGKHWENMIKGDLGGSEILDIVWGGKFLEQKFSLQPSQIGIEGGSHGGYSTLRALTLPQGFKGQDSKYPFGFGICWAGFADLVDFYKNSNIPDWLANMLGPYEKNQELYLDRSPVNHFEELCAPLFITHGTQDSRVPPSTMNGFIEKLKNSEIPHFIYNMSGQGHTGGSIDERIDEYEKMFHFLESVTKLGWEC
jgi:dipeptidyl aminopeptidase/acylaminoacyl peptidase